MKPTQNTIIPDLPVFYKVSQKRDWDFKAICIFVATGFFLDRDTYYTDTKVVPPGVDYQLDKDGKLISESSYFSWYHQPKDQSFEVSLSQFTSLFEDIIEHQTADLPVILPLSGGLDSRTQAAVLQHLNKKVNAYSYEFKGGYPETAIAQQIATVCDFPFKRLEVQNGYLWDNIETLASLNKCYSEFTHPRQMAFTELFSSMNGIFSLGHWGDVLFDRGAPAHIQQNDAVLYLKKKVIKKGGMYLATALWNHWGLEGDFETYLNDRLHQLWEGISIDNLSAKIRAFKSLYWAPRWTSTNLSVFRSSHPISLPYYHNEMCKFICTIPEDHLADRLLQIAYIKRRNPRLAKITWQKQRPFNLYNYEKNKTPWNLPYRITSKLQRSLNNLMGTPFIQRNWELQFVGKSNEEALKSYLFKDDLISWLSKELIEDCYQKFKKDDAVFYSHPLSMLLALSLKLKQTNAE